MLSVEKLVYVYLSFMYLMCIMLCFSPCTLRFFVCTPGTAALWRRRPERPNRGRVSFTQTLLDKPCANGTVAGTYMCKRLSLLIFIIPIDHPCDSVLGLFVCAGVDFRRSQARAAELWQGFVPQLHSLPPSLYLGQRLLDCFNSFACSTKNIHSLLLPNKDWERVSVLGFIDTD